jgi:hypothetical protein
MTLFTLTSARLLSDPKVAAPEVLVAAPYGISCGHLRYCSDVLSCLLSISTDCLLRY